MDSVACSSSDAGIHEVSEILNSISPSMMTGGGRVSVQFRNLLGAEGSNMETWKTGWMLHMESWRQRVKEMEPT